MKWLIIVFIMMSLIGSMMWVMPTPRQKYQAKLRMKAKALGYQVQLEKVTAPRAKGELEPESKDMTAYRILRHGLSKEEKNNFNSWQIFKVESIANTGLPEGWSWAHGENTLSQEQLEKISELLQQLPEGVFSVESSHVYMGLFWDEQGGDEMLEKLQQILEVFIEAKF